MDAALKVRLSLAHKRMAIESHTAHEFHMAYEFHIAYEIHTARSNMLVNRKHQRRRRDVC